MAEKVTIVHGKLQVPDEPIIPYVEGDGIGPDIWKATVRVMNAALKKFIMAKEKFTGRKYWPVKKLIMQRVNGCPSKPLMHAGNISSP